jgi:ribosomal protein S18 acetylase RimI-like enzyme
MEINIKKASKYEVDEILNLINGLYDHNYIPFEENKVRSALEKLLDDETLGYVWTVYDKDAIVGYCIVSLVYSLEHNGQIAIIDEIYIKKSHRNLGYGKAILGTIEDFCRAQDVHTVALEVEKHNVNAQVFFQLKGFQKRDRVTMIKSIP